MGNITNDLPSPMALYDYYPFGMLMPGRYVSDTANHCELVTETAPVLTTGYVGRSTLGSWCAPCSFVPFLGGTLGFGSGSMTVSATSIGDGASMDVSTVVGTPYSGSVTVSGMSGGTWTLQAVDITSSAILAATTVAQPQTASLNFTATGPSTRVIITANAVSSLFTITSVRLNFTTWTSGTIVTIVCSKNNDAYRYGYDGKLKDNEWAGIGNSYDFKMRGLDVRTGRFRSPDPLGIKYPWNSSYDFAENRVIDGVDLEGLEFRKAPGMFAADPDKVQIPIVKAPMVPQYYRVVMNAHDLPSLQHAIENTGYKRQVATAADGKDPSDISGAGKLAAIVSNLLTITKPDGTPMVWTPADENKAYDQTETQTRQFSWSQDIVNSAKKNNLLPKQFANNKNFVADLTNYIFDGTKVPGSGAKIEAYNKVVSLLGKELYDNKDAVLSGSYKRPPESVMVISPSWGLDQPAPKYYKENYQPTQVEQAVEEYNHTNGGSADAPSIHQTQTQ